MKWRCARCSLRSAGPVSTRSSVLATWRRWGRGRMASSRSWANSAVVASWGINTGLSFHTRRRVPPRCGVGSHIQRSPASRRVNQLDPEPLVSRRARFFAWLRAVLRNHTGEIDGAPLPRLATLAHGRHLGIHAAGGARRDADRHDRGSAGRWAHAPTDASTTSRPLAGKISRLCSVRGLIRRVVWAVGRAVAADWIPAQH